MHLRRPDDKPGDGAVWNFPMGRQGRLTLRLQLRKGAVGVTIALADRFFNPTDTEGEKQALILLPVRYVPALEARQKGEEGGWYALGGGLTAGVRLRSGVWYDLTLAWNLPAGECEVLVDGEPALVLPVLNETTSGVSYLRLRCNAEDIDAAGVLVERVTVDVTP